MNQPPKVLRIKRKRGQDPLQALILEDRRASKRSKPSTPATSQLPSPNHTPRPPSPLDLDKVAQSFYTLSRTDDLDKTAEDKLVIESVLRLVGDIENDDTATNAAAAADLIKQALKKSRKRKFVIPSHQTTEDTVIPNELSDMVNSYLNVNEEGSGKRKRRTKHSDSPELANPPATEGSLTSSDYVYDVYLLSNTQPLTTANHPQSQIGYIRFFDDADLLYQSDEEDNKPPVLSDDEDSNAEDFYQNDYPSDEDAGALSETNELASDEEDEEDGSVVGGINQLGEDDYDDYGDISYLPDDNHYEEDGDEDEEQPNFTRNKFFATDEHDPLAIHRDRIFGKLENMIDEQ